MALFTFFLLQSLKAHYYKEGHHSHPDRSYTLSEFFIHKFTPWCHHPIGPKMRQLKVPGSCSKSGSYAVTLRPFSCLIFGLIEPRFRLFRFSLSHQGWKKKVPAKSKFCDAIWAYTDVKELTVANASYDSSVPPPSKKWRHRRGKVICKKKSSNTY